MSGTQEPITNLADYITAIHQIASDQRFIYRGQKDERWHIHSGALRRLQKEPLNHPELLPYLFRGYLHQLIDEVQLRYASAYHNLTALECMAHLQHNSVATGLIDFTYNPLVALWFACEPDGATAGKVFVVTIDPAQIREITTKSALDQDLKRFFEEDGQWHLWQPSIDNSAIDTHRMTMQQSVFLFGLPTVAHSMIVREMLIPQAHKDTLRRELETLGISEKTLFSDLAGFLERNTAQSPYNRDLAEEYYTEEIRKAQGHEFSENYFQRATFRIALGKYKEALADYDRAIELQPDYVEAYNNRGIAKSELGRDEAAVADYDEAIGLKSDLADAYSNRGNAKSELGQHEAAVADYDEAIRLNPDLAAAYNNRGLAKQKLGEAALADYNEAIRLNPDYADAYYNRGLAKQKLGQHEAALTDYNEAIRLNPDYAEAYSQRGLAKYELGQHEAALADYNEAIRLNPDYALAYNNRGVAKQKLGELQAALADYNEAIRLNPDYADAYYNRGLAKQKLGQHEAALTDYNEAIRLNPDYAGAYYNRGAVKAVLDQREAAQQDFTTARDLAGKADNDSLRALAEQGLQSLANRGDA